MNTHRTIVTESLTRWHLIADNVPIQHKLFPRSTWNLIGRGREIWDSECFGFWMFQKSHYQKPYAFLCLLPRISTHSRKLVLTLLLHMYKIWTLSARIWEKNIFLAQIKNCHTFEGFFVCLSWKGVWLSDVFNTWWCIFRWLTVLTRWSWCSRPFLRQPYWFKIAG